MPPDRKKFEQRRWFRRVVQTGGGVRSSNTCFTLKSDGTCQYHGLTDSYGQNGGSTLPVGKADHPKTRDPMLILDGAAFVTFYQKPPWSLEVGTTPGLRQSPTA